MVEGGPFDTVSVTIISDGFARFTEVDSGNYVIAVATEVPAPFGLGEQDSVVFLPTYYPSSFR